MAREKYRSERRLERDPACPNEECNVTDEFVKRRQGFASMDPEKLRQISRKGGHTAQERGSAHRWTREEARSAGRKGGRASRRREPAIATPDESASSEWSTPTQ